MTEPIITLANSSTMTEINFNADIKMHYYLYADEYAFDNWTDWVNDSVNSPTQKNLDNASTFSNYVLKWKCELNKENQACGFKDENNGAIFINSNTAGEIAAVEDTRDVVSNTFVMTKA